MSSLKYSGNAEFQTGTLGSSYTSGGSSMSLTTGHGARFPSSGDFWIRVDDEILKVTARSTDTLTVAGAQDGTSAANHSSGATVRWVLSAGALTQLRGDLVQTGTYASIPSASSVAAGTLYIPTGSIYTFARSNGSDWDWFFDGAKVTIPPTSWTTINGSTETLTQTNGYVYFDIPAAASDNVRARVTSVTAPYTVTMAISSMFVRTDYVSCGLIARESSSGKLIAFGQVQNSIDAAGLGIYSYYHASPTSGGSARGTAVKHHRDWIWLKIQDNSTSRILSYSVDNGNTWIQYSSSSRTTDLTADQVGFACNTTNSNGASLIMPHFKVE